ncbi:MAG TPA: hypothetical protein VMW76_03325 [Bacteroidales bacterium]|nr:hypothetical protein [Bacteroidales bacterium]
MIIPINARKHCIVYFLNFLLLFLSSCYTSHALKGDSDLSRFSERGDVEVLMAVTKTGEVYYFNKNSPAWIINRTVTGPPERILGYKQVDSLVKAKSGLPEYVISEGHRYKILNLSRTNYICQDTDSIRLALSDISQLKILKQNDFGFGLIFMIVLGSIGFMIGGAFLFIL